MSNEWKWAAAAVTVIILFVVGITWAVGHAASQSTAESALRTQGFSQIHLTKRHSFAVQFQGCGKEDVAKFDFTARNAAGRIVRVSVCEGWPFKGATIRGT